LPAKQAVAIPAAGGRAPAFTATTDAGERLSLSSLHGRWVILFFYPKDDTSG
jgi:thioredoxin-dependent peroxiredoxin